MEKTNVMRLLEQKKIAYTAHSYEADATKTGEEIAALLGIEVNSAKVLLSRARKWMLNQCTMHNA